jgi:PucR C-terminal helix-turn-helix domain/GGDEF-like domain
VGGSASLSAGLESRGHEVQLADCIQLLQTDVIHANPTADNLGHPVSDVMMYDPLDPGLAAHNQLVLAVGIGVAAPQFDQLLDWAAATDAAAVVVKGHGSSLPQVRSAAARHDVAVLVAPDDADWTGLVALARASVVGAAADSVSGVRLGDLYAFANAVASLTNGAASIVDTVGRILGYSTLPGQPIDELRRATTLALQEMTQPALDADYRLLYAAVGARVLPSGNGGFDRLALAVRAGGELLGSIWVLDPGRDRRLDALAMLDRLAPVAALHMLRARSAFDFGERRNADLIRTIMDDPAHASFAAAQLGLEAVNGIAVAAFVIARSDPGSLEAVRELQRLLHLVTATCNMQFDRGHGALIDSVVYALLPSSGASPRAVQRRVAEEIGRASRSISTFPVLTGIGGIVDNLVDLPQSKSEAMSLLQNVLLRRVAARAGEGAGAGAANATLGGPAVALFEDHRAQLNLVRVGALLTQEGLGNVDDLERIRAHDEQQQSDLMLTLRAFLDCHGNVAAVAKQLHVHNNTVRYRLARLVEDFNVHLDDPAERLWLWLRLVSLDRE